MLPIVSKGPKFGTDEETSNPRICVVDRSEEPTTSVTQRFIKVAQLEASLGRERKSVPDFARTIGNADLWDLRDRWTCNDLGTIHRQ